MKWKIISALKLRCERYIFSRIFINTIVYLLMGTSFYISFFYRLLMTFLNLVTLGGFTWASCSWQSNVYGNRHENPVVHCKRISNAWCANVGDDDKPASKRCLVTLIFYFFFKFFFLELQIVSLRKYRIWQNKEFNSYLFIIILNVKSERFVWIDKTSAVYGWNPSPHLIDRWRKRADMHNVRKLPELSVIKYWKTSYGVRCF